MVYECYYSQLYVVICTYLLLYVRVSALFNAGRVNVSTVGLGL